MPCPCRDDADCTGPGCCGPSRREFLQVDRPGRGGLAGVARARASPMAGPFDASDFARLVPPDKKLDPAWVKSLFARGERTIYRGEDLALIGMPIGGLCAGQLYLGGDGRLWHWDIFNRVEHTNEAHYANPMRPGSPLDQGFAIRLKRGDTTEIRTLDRAGFSDIRFRGEYPIGFVDYRDDDLPVEVSLEAFSPFIPLNTEDSSLPATILDLHGQERLAAADRGRARRLARERRRPRHRTSGRRVQGEPGRARAGPALPRVCLGGRAGGCRPGAAAGHRPGRLRGRNLRRLDRRGPGLRRSPQRRRRRTRAAPAAASWARAWSTPGPAATRPRASWSRPSSGSIATTSTS